MAVTYLRLFDPTQQFQLKNGALNVSGRLFVYLEGTDDLAALYDENGTQLSQPVVLDNNGRATGLFVDSKKVYRLQVNDQYGELLFTIRKMAPCGGGAGSALGTTYNVISSDGTIEVTPYDDNGTRVFDLSNSNAQELQYVRTDSFTLTTLTVDNTCVLTPTHRVDGNMDVDANGIKLTGGVIYNVSVYIHMEASDPNVNRFDGVKFRLFANDAPYAEYTFSESYDHKQVACISCDIHPESDTYFKVYVENLANGTILTCNQCTIHSVASSYVVNGGGGGDYQAGEGIIITGDTISVDQSVIQHKLVAGDNITINNVTNTISADLSGKADKVEDATAGNLAGLDATGNLTDSGIAASDVATQSDLSGKQDTLTTGPNVDIINNIISTEKTVVAAGQNVSVTSSLDSLTRTVTYTVNASGAAAQIQSDWTQSDSSSVDYIKNKPTEKTLVAGSNITITESGSNVTISSTSAPQVQSDWSQSNSSAVDFIKNKPQNLVQDASYVHTDNNFTNADKNKLDGIESGAEANVQANWNETNSSSDAYIQNKPQNLVQDANYVHTDTNFTNADKSKLDGIESGAEANVQANWNETNSSSDAYIQNKPDLSQYATTTDLSDKADKVDGATNGNLAGLDSNGNLTDSGIAASDVATQSDLSGKQDTLTPGSNVTITNNVISATDTNTHRPIQVGGSQILGDNTDPLNFVAGSNVTITNNNGSLTIAASGGTFTQEQSDWAQTNSSSVDFIKNKPTEKSLVAGSNITLVEGNNNVTVSATVPVVGTVVV